MTRPKIHWNEPTLPPMNLWNLPLPKDNFTFKEIDGHLCIVYKEGRYEFVKLVMDKQELETIKKQKENYGY